ncbi:hypothetical protein XalbCFBP2523_12350 [Xanthomonas albilineans]|nr:hypothetical protein XalbCFBP2523_12350 [Xanthomonas albilineans]
MTDSTVKEKDRGILGNATGTSRCAWEYRRDGDNGLIATCGGGGEEKRKKPATLARAGFVGLP